VHHPLRTGPDGLPGLPIWIRSIGIPIIFHGLVDGLIDRFEGLREVRGGQSSHLDKFDHDLFTGPQNMLFQISFFHGVRLSNAVVDKMQYRAPAVSTAVAAAAFHDLTLCLKSFINKRFF
jgi:hypothetical protein